MYQCVCLSMASDTINAPFSMLFYLAWIVGVSGNGFHVQMVIARYGCALLRFIYFSIIIVLCNAYLYYYGSLCLE